MPPVADPVTELVTWTLTVPSARVAGDTAVICVGESSVTLAAGSVPNLTVLPVMKPVPVMTTVSPPRQPPQAGGGVQIAHQGRHPGRAQGFAAVRRGSTRRRS